MIKFATETYRNIFIKLGQNTSVVSLVAHWPSLIFFSSTVCSRSTNRCNVKLYFVNHFTFTIILQRITFVYVSLQNLLNWTFIKKQTIMSQLKLTLEISLVQL